MPRTRAVLFDAGLTLLRPHPTMGEVYASVCRRHGRPADAEALEHAANDAFHRQAEGIRAAGGERLRTSDAIERENWRHHARQVADGVPALRGVDFDAWFDDLYDTFGGCEAWRPFDDAAPTLRALRDRGFALAVVTNWDLRVRRILEESGLLPHFDAVVISAEVGWRKPHRAIFETALAALAVPAAEALHVGDSRGDDVEGAEAAGIRGVLLDRAGRAAAGVPAVRRLSDLLAMEGLR